MVFAKRRNPTSPTVLITWSFGIIYFHFTLHLLYVQVNNARTRRETPFSLQLMGAFPPYKPTAVVRRFCRLAKTLYIDISENYRPHITYNAERLFCKNKVELGIMIISVSFLPSVNSSVAKINFQEIH